MDKFYTRKFCDRCGCDLKNGRTMSRFNTDCICLSCSEKEKKDPDYDMAVKADIEEIKKGNFNFKGIRAKNDKYIIPEKVIDQIMIIRAQAKFNMLDYIAVQCEAFEKGFYELTIFIEEHKIDYINLIISGKR